MFSTAPAEVWPAQLERLSSAPRRDPFDPAVLALVGDISARILRSAIGRDYPELAALAHWFRPASLQRMKDEQLRQAGAHAVRPRGCVFIVAPANVDVLFIYGWLLSLISGNVTVVRVSQKPSEVREVFLRLVEDVASDGNAARLLSDSLVISYPHDSSATADLSAWCDLRLIWGGDATINTIRSVRLKPTAVEGAFADRFSIAAFDAAGMLAQDEARNAELARRFANDTMWFGQQACSSPRALFWIGTPDAVAAAQRLFWPLFAAAAVRFEDEPAAMMSRVTDLFIMAGEGVIDRVDGPLGALPARGNGGDPSGQLRELHSGFGLFVEYRLDTLADLEPYLVDKDQTLVVEGVAADDVQALVDRLPNRSLDRIVSVGQATDFATSWDGINLLDLMTRRISVPRRVQREAAISEAVR